MTSSENKIDKLKIQYRSFIETHLFPLETTEVLQSNFSKIENKLLEIKEGLFVLHHGSEEHLSLYAFAQISEELAKSPFGHFVFNVQAPDIGNMELLSLAAPDSIKEKYLVPLQEGKIRSCFSMTEPHFAGSNPTLMGTTAVKDGDEYIINGHKWFTTGADGAAFTIVMAISHPEEEIHRKASMILVPMNTPGVSLVRNIPVMGHSGDSWASHSEIKYENVKVPISNLIGKEKEGFKLAQARLGPGRIHHCMRFIGIAQRSLDIMINYTKKRFFDDKLRLSDMQLIQAFIAESYAEINAVRLYVLETAKKIDLNGAEAAKADISAIKFLASNTMLKVIDRAIQSLGALGMSSDVILSFWYAHERASRIYDGADEVHKISLAKNLLKRES
jgi:acyl-CoA dehydrogenase